MDHISIRPIRPCDEAALELFYAELSQDTRCARFLGTSGMDERCARRMSAPGADEAGFVAEQVDRAGSRIVGHVSLTLAEDDEPEIAIAVGDAWQHHGIGRRLFLAATSWAERSDVHTLVATAFTDNWRVIQLLRSSGHKTIVRDLGCGLTSIAISLTDRTQLKPAA